MVILMNLRQNSPTLSNCCWFFSTDFPAFFSTYPNDASSPLCSFSYTCNRLPSLQVAFVFTPMSWCAFYTWGNSGFRAHTPIDRSNKSYWNPSRYLCPRVLAFSCFQFTSLFWSWLLIFVSYPAIWVFQDGQTLRGWFCFMLGLWLFDWWGLLRSGMLRGLRCRSSFFVIFINETVQNNFLKKFKFISI